MLLCAGTKISKPECLSAASKESQTLACLIMKSRQQSAIITAVAVILLTCKVHCYIKAQLIYISMSQDSSCKQVADAHCMQ